MNEAASQASVCGSADSEETVDLSLVLAMTEQVEAAIAAGEWHQAAELEAQRRKALVTLLERSGGATAPALRDALSGVVAKTHRMIGEAHHHRRSLLMEASMVRLGRKAADEYDRNST